MQDFTEKILIMKNKIFLFILLFSIILSLNSQTLVKDINPVSGQNGCLSTLAYNTVKIGDWLYFLVNDGVQGVQVWRSNGETDQTLPITNWDPVVNDFQSVYLYPIVDGEVFISGKVGSETHLLRITNPTVNIIADLITKEYIIPRAYLSSLIRHQDNLYFINSSSIYTPGEIYKINLTTGILQQLSTDAKVLFLNDGNHAIEHNNGLPEYELALLDNCIYFFSWESASQTIIFKKIDLNTYALTSIAGQMGENLIHGFVNTIHNVPVVYNGSIFFKSYFNNILKVGLFKYTPGMNEFIEVSDVMNGRSHFDGNHLTVFENNLYFISTNSDIDLKQFVFKINNLGMIIKTDIESFSTGFRTDCPYRIIKTETANQFLYQKGNGQIINISDNIEVSNLMMPGGTSLSNLIGIGANYYFWLNNGNSDLKLFRNNSQLYLDNFDYRCDCVGFPFHRVGDKYLFFSSLDGLNEGLELYSLSASSLRLVSAIEKNIKSTIVITPNPSNEYIKINSSIEDIDILGITDLSGKHFVLQHFIKNGSLILNTSSLHSGVYNLVFQTKNYGVIRKVFVKI